MSDQPQPIPFAPHWTRYRWEQIFAMETLIHETAAINRGSSALERIQRCIELAEKLTQWHDEPGGSFANFLKDRALQNDSKP